MHSSRQASQAAADDDDVEKLGHRMCVMNEIKLGCLNDIV
jgi:hypothetical protein